MKLRNKTIHHRTIKMKPIDVTASTYIYFGLENDNRDPKVKVSDYSIIFAKGYTPNWSSEVL